MAETGERRWPVGKPYSKERCAAEAGYVKGWDEAEKQKERQNLGAERALREGAEREIKRLREMLRRHDEREDIERQKREPSNAQQESLVDCHYALDLAEAYGNDQYEKLAEERAHADKLAEAAYNYRRGIISGTAAFARGLEAVLTEHQERRNG